MTIAISVKNVGKRYQIGAAESKFRYNMLRDVLVDTFYAPVRLVKALAGKSDRRTNQNFVWALKDISFDVDEGKVLGIVGRNGAGKSTLLKLLCRFYDPHEGRIEIDGHDLRGFGVDDLRRSITVLFQQPFHYNTTIRENILYGDLEFDFSEAEIEAAIRAAGAEEIVARLPQQEQTLLGRWFAGGMELSVGEWQRIALARAFLRRAPIIILDEPTSALDPWAEADWIERFRELALGRTSIIITHRFTTAMHADVIHVMDRGRIVESGSHQRLLENGGLYAKSWSRQMTSIPSTDYTEPAKSVSV